MTRDRITQLRIAGLRAIDHLTLDLRGLTVLIGDNGTGKSSILEALELLRQAAKPISYTNDIVVRAHGPFRSLLHRGSRELRLGITIEGAGPRVDYDFAIANVGPSPAIVEERVDIFVNPTADEPLHALIREGSKTLIFDRASRKLALAEDVVIPTPERAQHTFGDNTLALPWLGVDAQPAFQRVTSALNGIQVHVPFETRPLWQQRELDLRVGPRWPTLLDQSVMLERYALNLPNAYQQLRNLGNEVWARVIKHAQLGLGDDVRDFRLPGSGGGNIELEVVFGSAPDKPMPASSLSEGQLSYLAFIALTELDNDRPVLAFDEPELHLHPALLSRVVWMLEQSAASSPVVVSTHSDRFLDALDDPAGTVVLCDLDPQGATRIRRPDSERLKDWMQSYRGIGSLRAEGYEAHVFADPLKDPQA